MLERERWILVLMKCLRVCKVPMDLCSGEGKSVEDEKRAGGKVLEEDVLHS